MERNERELDPEQSKLLLSRCTDGVLCVIGYDGYPYGVPISYALADGKLYMHGTSGRSHKLDALRRNPKACLTVVDRRELDAENYSVSYSSVIVFGSVRIIEQRDEKLAALRVFMRTLAPEAAGRAIEHCKKDIDAFVMFEMIQEHMTGKARR